MPFSDSFLDIFCSVVRWVIPLLTFFFLLRCILSMIRTQPQRKAMALLINAANHDELLLTRWENSVGRSRGCDIVLNYPPISRSHAVISLRGATWTITDTFSKTGVFINDKPIEKGKPTPVNNGDKVKFGQILMIFRRIDNRVG